MRKVLTLVAVHAIFFCAVAQKKEIPDFGKIDKAEFEKKTCDYDPDAPAEMIFNSGESSCRMNETAYSYVYNTEMKRHIRIKILNDKGLSQANIKMVYRSSGNANRIINIAAQTYNLDASGNIVISKVEKKLIYEKRIDKKFSEIAFTFPEVKPGSIIEYKYMLFSEGFSLPDWDFQSSIPVRYSRCLVEIPKGIEFFGDPAYTFPVETKFEEYSQSYSRTYVMRNVPGLPDEPYMSSEDDYLQRIAFRFSAINTRYGRESILPTWEKVMKSLMEDEDFGLQLKRNIPRTKELDEQLKTQTDAYRKMCITYEYVRKNMEWDGTMSKWALDGVKSAWEKKKGTSGEINLILVNLLKDAGIDASPLLISTRDNGMVNSFLPYIDQFNSVVAHVKIGEQLYVLDATDRYTPAFMIPHNIMHTQGMVIKKVDESKSVAEQGWGWVTLWNEKNTFHKQVAIQSTLQDNGAITGEALISSIGYARVDHLKDWKKNEAEFRQVHYIKPYNGINIEGFEVSNAEKDSLPFTQKFKFSIPANASGDYQYFSVNLFAGLEENPFVSDSRYSDILFGSNQQYVIYGRFSIPAGYAFEELPKNMRMIMPDTSISLTRFMEKEGNSLGMRIVLEFKKPYYLIDDYPLFKEFYKKLFAILNEQVVIRKSKP